MTLRDEKHISVTPDRLRSLFEPDSIAIVGASETSGWSTNLVNSIECSGAKSEIVLVNPVQKAIFGRPTIPDISDISRPVDLAFILLGPEKVGSVLDRANSVGIKNAVVLAGGYGESGDQGSLRQTDLTDQANRLGMTVLGPNTIGYINAVGGFAPWAVAMSEAPIPGPVGAVFESGSMSRAAFQFAQAHGIGVTIWASVGNSAIVNVLDVLDYLISDDATRSVALFLETIRQPARFLALCQKALEIGKPIVILKVGRSEEGKRSAMAHTGAVATDDAVTDAAFRRAGVVRVGDLEELVATAGLFGYSKRLPQGRRMGVVTSSGGGCNVIADVAMHQGLDLPPWAEATTERLTTLMPPYATLLNPLDTTGYGHSRRRHRPTKAEDDLLELAALDPGIDFMFTMMTPLPAYRAKAPTEIEARMRILGEIVAASPVPIYLASNTCMDVTEYARSLLIGNGLHLLPGCELGMRAIGHAARWVEQRENGISRRPAQAEIQSPKVIRMDISGPWSEEEGRTLLQESGAHVIPALLATSRREAIRAEEVFGSPVALKICSREVPHKSDVGGVILNVVGRKGVEAAYDEIVRSIHKMIPQVEIDGVLISPMRQPGIDLLVGVTVDPTFGPVLTVGLGGIWVEILGDASVSVLPVDRLGIRDMLMRLRGAALLQGARGAEPVDLDKLSEEIVRITVAACSLGERLEAFEVNPLRIGPDGIEALDVLVSTTVSPGSQR